MATPRFVSGGSVANTAVGLAALGGRAGFVGAVADDEVGHTYVENLRAAGVAVRAASTAIARGRCPGNRPLHGAHLRRRGADDGHLPGGGVHPDRGRGVGVLRRAGRRRAARGVPLGCGCGQGGHASCRRHRPRSGRLGRPVALGSVLRRTSPARVPGPPRRRHRHLAGQRRGDHHAVRGGLAHGGPRGGGGNRAARRHDAWSRGLRSS